MNTDERYDADGRCVPSTLIQYKQKAKTPERLLWDVDSHLDTVISTAYNLAIKVQVASPLVAV